MELKYKFIEAKITYTGKELSSHWIYKNFNLQGNSLVAFIGPVRVKEHLVDIADLKKNKYIESSLMLHFISEYFDLDLEKTMLRQRLFISLLAQEINHVRKRCSNVERRGDDLYVKDKKLSVAIATLSPVSSIFHVGLNVISTGTPVKAIGLRDLSIPPKPLATRMFKLYARELETITMARAKVRGVL